MVIKKGYFTMLRSVTEKSDIISLIKNWSVDGIIFLYPEEPDFIQSFIYIVQCLIAIFDADLRIPDLINVSSDDWHGLYLSALEECCIPFREEYIFSYPPTYEGGVKAGKEITLSRKAGQKASFLPLLRRKSRSG